MKRIYLVIITLCLMGFQLKAQNTENPWSLGFYYSGLNFRALDGDWFDRINSGAGVNVGRSLNSSFNLVSSFSMNEMDASKGPDKGYELNVQNSALSLDLDLGVQYRFANGYMLKETSWFDPYLQVGGGVNFIDGDAKGLLNAGLGVNLWLNTTGPGNVGFFVQTDYDYLPNFNNYLHHKVGLKVRMGGKDTDNDGVVDSQDLCPNEAGLAKFMGCPDTDADGIADKDDSCPRVAGLESMGGCPDTDADGIADKDDSCPQVAGIESLGGCPDADGDGVADKNDDCPNVAGTKSLKGCPDADGDGIADKSDDCPNVAGVKEFNGCPDSDGDGIMDKEDKCPNEAGVKRLNGCPEPKIDVEEVEQKLSMSAKRIQFATGSSIIAQKSYPDLEKILALMNSYPDSKFKVEGYTDNVGNPNSNKALSQKRADAVKAYFVKKGISGDRLTSTGYGIKNPIVSNATAQGRAQNRRVEIHLAE